MQIDIEKIAKLAALPLSEEEKSTLKPQLDQILDFVEALKSVDTTNIAPTVQVTGHTNVWRTDKAIAGLTTKESTMNARKSANGLIITEQVLSYEE